MFWERGIRQQRKYEMAERERSLRSALIRAAVAAVSLSFAILEKTLWRGGGFLAFYDKFAASVFARPDSFEFTLPIITFFEIS